MGRSCKGVPAAIFRNELNHPRGLRLNCFCGERERETDGFACCQTTIRRTCVNRDPSNQLNIHNLFGKSGAFLPPLNSPNISSPIHTLRLLAIPDSISAIRSAWINIPFPLLCIPCWISCATVRATELARLIGTPTFSMPAAHLSMFSEDRSLRSWDRMGVMVMPGATTEMAMESLARSFLRARRRPTIPVRNNTHMTHQFLLLMMEGTVKGGYLHWVGG